MDIEKIIDLCGGKEALAAHLAECGPKPLTIDAMRKWKGNGIPSWYWNAIVEAAGGKVTVDQIHHASSVARDRRRRSA